MSPALTGVTVVELGGFLAAPYATSLLASLGAEVVKVEPPPPGEPYRRGIGVADPYFVQYNAGKLSLSLNIKTESGMDILVRLLEQADVLVHNFRPGKAEALGLGYEELAPRFPSLVYASLSGFGNAGELAQRPGYDSAAESLSGLYARLGHDAGLRPGGLPLADTTTGVFVALGVCSALARRHITGEGCLIETSLFEVSSMLSTEGSAERVQKVAPDRSGDPGDAAVSQVYCLTCADGDSITVALGDSEERWSGLVGIMSDATPIPIANSRSAGNYLDRVHNYRDIEATLQTAAQSFDSTALLDSFRRGGIPARTVRRYLQAFDEDGSAAAPMQRRKGEVQLLKMFR
ncbi:CaiB/BaiF CoA-transferase family protein [Rhodococcus opacus]|nr:CaiB/BaiF CoA-transferase family protein [Rhodococcus opacus]